MQKKRAYLKKTKQSGNEIDIYQITTKHQLRSV